MMKRILLLAILPFGLTTAFEPTVESLSKVEPAPEWFRDAKVGIYFHWGVYSVPAFGTEWYPRFMHRRGEKFNLHHVETWGDPLEFTYADFVPMFTAENFDADEWAELFMQSGARFAGPVVEHHDGFALWDSKLTPWNSVDRGPKRDITGELEKAIRRRDMKFVTTFHHARNLLWQQEDGKWTGHYQWVKEHYPTLLEDPQLAMLYGYMEPDDFYKMWKDKLVEVIDNYQPDLIWFDSWLHEVPEKIRFEFAAYYYNKAEEWGRDVVITRKQDDLPLSFSLEDWEMGRADSLTENVWLTDDTITNGSWCYTRDIKIKEANEVVDTMIDIVSKNGQLLLNIAPMADGTIPENQRKVILAMGEWLKVNGEAIYNTRPWLAYGEGPTKMKRGGHFVGKVAYGGKDIRYTRSKNGKTLYATLLGEPEGPFTLTLVAAKDRGKGKVSLLGSKAEIRHEITAGGQLVIHPPEGAMPSPYAHSFRLTGFEFELATHSN